MLPAQDLHFTQFHNAPQSLNPALSGAYTADHRFGANYRTQWQSVPVPYETLAASYSRKVAGPGAHELGLGGYLLYDQAGDGQLSWLQIALSAAFHLRLSEAHRLSAGLQARLGQRSFQPGAFRFGDQFADNFFDPLSPSAELLPNNSANFSSLGAGLNWRYAADYSRTQLWAGIGSAHLNEPRMSFLAEEGVRIPRLFNVHAMGWVELQPDWDFAFSLLGQRQGSYRELLGLAGARYHLDALTGLPLAVQLSAGYRLSDAALIALALFYREWRFGLSYDINTSPFRQATNGRGGAELSLQYLITEVKPPKAFKACPIF